MTVFHLVQDLHDQGVVVRGRQLINILWHSMALGVWQHPFHTMLHMIQIQLQGNALEKFRMTWFTCLRGMEKRPDDMFLRDTFALQMRKCPLLNDDMKDYDNYTQVDTRKTYDHLWTILDKHIGKHTEAKNVQDMMNASLRPQMTLSKSHVNATGKTW